MIPFGCRWEVRRTFEVLHRPYLCSLHQSSVVRLALCLFPDLILHGCDTLLDEMKTKVKGSFKFLLCFLLGPLLFLFFFFPASISELLGVKEGFILAFFQMSSCFFLRDSLLPCLWRLILICILFLVLKILSNYVSELLLV